MLVNNARPMRIWRPRGRKSAVRELGESEVCEGERCGGERYPAPQRGEATTGRQRQRQHLAGDAQDQVAFSGMHPVLKAVFTGCRS